MFEKMIHQNGDEKCTAQRMDTLNFFVVKIKTSKDRLNRSVPRQDARFLLTVCVSEDVGYFLKSRKNQVNAFVLK